VTLQFDPGPGLTLVPDRNGSGKSSFVEAAKFVLTGDNLRWGGRPAAWKEGWRNLHAAHATRIAIDLAMSGSSEVTTVSCSWQPDDGLNGGKWTVRHGEKVQRFDADGWQEPLRTYRLFLSYSELGNRFDGTPSELHDALHQLLGLGALTPRRSASAPSARGTPPTPRRREARRELRTDLEAVDDERATSAAARLKHTTPTRPLAAVAEIALGADDHTSDVAALRRLARLELPSGASSYGTGPTTYAQPSTEWPGAALARAAPRNALQNCRIVYCTTTSSKSPGRVPPLRPGRILRQPVYLLMLPPLRGAVRTRARR